MKTRFIVALVWALPLAVAPSSAEAQIIVNGSFETPTTPSYVTITAGQSSLAPWIVGLTGVDLAGSGNPFILGPAFDGSQYIDLDGTPGPGQLTQSFATTPGQLYFVTFAYANAYPNQPSASASVRVFDGLGDRLTQTVTHNSSVPGNLNWTLFSGQFTAMQSTTSFEITSLSGINSFGGILLDGVQVVPEPGSVVLLLLGTALFFRRQGIERR